MTLTWKQAAPAFLLGLALGAAGGSVIQRTMFRHFMKNGPDPRRMLSRLSRDLSLDEGQKKSVLAVLESHKQEIDALRKEGDEKFSAVRAATNEDIRKLLTPGQIVKFDELNARWEKRHRERRGGP